MTSVPIERVVAESHRALKRGDAVRAISMVRELARQAPHDPRSRLLQGMTANLFGQGDDAVRLLGLVVNELTGDDQRLAQMHLARARLTAGDTPGALAEIEPLATGAEVPGLAVAIKAEALIAEGRLDEAEGWLNSASHADNDSHHPAIARAGLALATPAGDASLAGREQRAIDEITADQERVGVPGSALSEMLLRLGELLARRGEDRQAARMFKRSAGLNTSDADIRPYAQAIMAVVNGWSEATVARARRAGSGLAATTERPVFVVGMPGGGPELASRLLAACAGASVIRDPETLTSAVARHLSTAASGGQPIITDPGKLTGRQLETAAEDYLRRSDPGDESVSRVVDDFPLNLHALGVVAQLFPKARVVVVRRDPFDACFGCMLRHRDPRLFYAHDPRTLAVFAGALSRLEDRWIDLFAGDRLGLACRVIDYAELVDSAEAGRSLIEFAGLAPIGDETIKSLVARHTRWTGHGVGLEARFGGVMPDLSEAVGKGEIGRV